MPGYRLNDNDLSCQEGYIGPKLSFLSLIGGSWVSTRCGHDAECRKARKRFELDLRRFRQVMEFTGCKRPVKCSPLRIDPCERDNLGCWDVEAPLRFAFKAIV